MQSRFKVLIVSSLLFATSALAGTTEMKRGGVSSGMSDIFPAKKSTDVTVKGTIVPRGDACVKAVPAVAVKLERRKGGKGSTDYSLVAQKQVTLTGSLSVPFKTQGNADGVYRITWVPKPNASMSCTFDQSLVVDYVDPDPSSEVTADDDDSEE